VREFLCGSHILIENRLSETCSDRQIFRNSFHIFCLEAIRSGFESSAIFGLDCNKCERVLIRFIGSNKK
jgi:hypothetical protein